MAKMTLDDLVTQLSAVYGHDLVGVALYGSAARGEHVAKHSDLNVIVVVQRISMEHLRKEAPVARGWREAGNPPPLTMTRAEWLGSADIFPIEYADILAHHKVLAGTLPLDGVAVVDIGRLFPGSPAAQIAGVADVVVLVAPPDPGPLAATLEWVARRGQFAATDAQIDAGRVRILTVDVAAERRLRIDPGRLARDQLGPVYAGHVPFDAGALDLLCRGASIGHRSLRRSRLALGVDGLLARLRVGVTV